MSSNGQTWKKFSPRLSVYQTLPSDVFMKSKEMPPYSEISEHQHDWDQLIYAKSGVLEIHTQHGHYITPPQQGVWIPANQRHNITTISGAKLRSVHINKGLVESFKQVCVLKIDELLRQLINKAASFNYTTEMELNQVRLLQVLIDQIALSPQSALCLPLSDDALLLPIILWQQQYPHSIKSLEHWSLELGASNKTIARRFISELGMSFSHWREQLKLHQAIHWLEQQRSITEIALDLGYQSLPAFIHMFKRNMGTTPGKFCKR